MGEDWIGTVPCFVLKHNLLFHTQCAACCAVSVMNGFISQGARAAGEQQTSCSLFACTNTQIVLPTVEFRDPWGSAAFSSCKTQALKRMWTGGEGTEFWDCGGISEIRNRASVRGAGSAGSDVCWEDMGKSRCPEMLKRGISTKEEQTWHRKLSRGIFDEGCLGNTLLELWVALARWDKLCYTKNLGFHIGLILFLWTDLS